MNTRKQMLGVPALLRHAKRPKWLLGLQRAVASLEADTLLRSGKCVKAGTEGLLLFGVPYQVSEELPEGLVEVTLDVSRSRPMS